MADTTNESENKDRTIEELRAEIAELKKALFDRQGKAAPVTAAAADRELTKEEKRQVAAACGAFGIDEKYIVKARIENGAAVILTAGGARVRYKAGDEKDKKFTRLSQIQVTGINPAQKRKPILGRNSAARED